MIDERFFSELETMKNDFAILSQKLESKSQAVHILHQALEKCQGERDEFKRMAEQVMGRYQLLRRTVSLDTSVDSFSADYISQLSRKQIAALLVESSEANKSLQQELNQLKSKLGEAYGDIDLLSKQIQTHLPENESTKTWKLASADKQRMVVHMEKMTAHINELEHELSHTMDEKQELSIERDIYRNKCDRLNNELNYILNGDERKLVDIDALIMERKFLKYRLKTMEEEKRLAMTTLSKYQKLTERKLSKTSSATPEDHSSSTESPAHNATLNSEESTSQSVHRESGISPSGNDESTVDMSPSATTSNEHVSFDSRVGDPTGTH